MSDEGRKKVLVVALGALVFVPLIGWRSWQALRAAPASDDWSQWIHVETHATAPDWYRAREVFAAAKAPRGPHLRLATLRFRQSLDHLKATVRNDRANFPPLYQRALELGGNLYVNELIDEEVPGLPEGEGELVQGIFLVHAGPVPAHVKQQAGRYLCQATDVLPASAAEAAGLVAGDDFVAVDDAPVVGSEEPCDAVVAEMKGEAGSTKRLRVLRGGELVELTLTKRDGVNGYRYQAVPILD